MLARVLGWGMPMFAVFHADKRARARRHRALSGAVLALLAVLAWSAARAAPSTDAATIAHAGNGHGAAPCMACHGDHGQGNAAAAYPRLAGLDTAYLRKQLEDYASGSRENPVMQATARSLTPHERAAMAAYYGAMPIPAAVRKGAATPPGDGAPGAALALWGRWKDKVPACVRCHGPHGVGVGAHFPPLAGQPAAYLANQLTAWKDGKRHNDPLGLMQHVSSALDAADIKAVSAWFAGQPAVPAEGAP